MSKEQLKAEVAHYWNQASCGTEHIQEEKFSKDYFENADIFAFVRDKRKIEIWSRDFFLSLLPQLQFV